MRTFQVEYHKKPEAGYVFGQIAELNHVTGWGRDRASARNDVRKAAALLTSALKADGMTETEVPAGPTRSWDDSLPLSGTVSLRDVRAHLQRVGFKSVARGERHEVFQQAKQFCVIPTRARHLPIPLVDQVLERQAAIALPDFAEFPIPWQYADAAKRLVNTVGRHWKGALLGAMAAVGAAVLVATHVMEEENARYVLSAVAQSLAAVLGLAITISLVAAPLAKYRPPRWGLEGADYGFGILLSLGIAVPLVLLALGWHQLTWISVALLVLCLYAVFLYMGFVRERFSPEGVLRRLSKEQARTTHPDGHDILAIGKEAAKRRDYRTAALAVKHLLFAEGERFRRNNQGYGGFGADNHARGKPVGQVAELVYEIRDDFSSFRHSLAECEDTACGRITEAKASVKYNLGLAFSARAYQDVMCVLYSLTWRLFRDGDKGNAQICASAMAETAFAECHARGV
ncbi:MAG: hypothetical protein KKI08_09165 [Armatimonadetes bacterium]|nr:hypothetical protein [Armatimonadota bacterium]